MLAVCGCVRHPFTEWNMSERERETRRTDTNEFIRNKEDVATKRNDRRGKHHMVESCEETPPTGTTFKQRTASTATEPSESRGNHLDKHINQHTTTSLRRHFDLSAEHTMQHKLHCTHHTLPQFHSKL